jgi:hypothetical protein
LVSEGDRDALHESAAELVDEFNETIDDTRGYAPSSVDGFPSHFRLTPHT